MAPRCRSNSARWASVKNSWVAYLDERCRGVSVSSVQMPCRSGSPQGVVSAGVGFVAEAAATCADDRVMDADTTTPTAAPATATVIIEPENFSRMMASFCPAIPYGNGFPMNLGEHGW